MWKLKPGVSETDIELAADQLGMIQASKGTLRKYAGCVHWHYRVPDSAGTIEVTLMEDSLDGWVEVRSNRSSPDALRLAEQLAKVLR